LSVCFGTFPELILWTNSCLAAAAAILWVLQVEVEGKAEWRFRPVGRLMSAPDQPVGMRNEWTSGYRPDKILVGRPFLAIQCR
jgi:hypothetical protein